MKKIYAVVSIFFLSVFFLTAQITQTFNYTGAVQTFTVPSCVFSLALQVSGSQGGSNAQNVSGGLGGVATGNLAVTPGDVLNIYVGGTIGFNGGGTSSQPGCNNATGGVGGGASDIRLNSSSVANRVIVGGGGGGAGGNRILGCGRGSGGGGGGGYYGGGGGAGWPYASTTLPTGGSQSAGGGAGLSTYTPLNNGSPGSLAQGGNGGLEVQSNQGGSAAALAGGGGGGLNGLNGAYGANWTGQSGAGGSSYIGGVTAGTTTGGVVSGNGLVVITYTPGGNPPATPSVITGPISACAGALGLVFSIPPVPFATTYNWIAPTGSTIVSGQGTNTIVVNLGSSSGNVSVTAGNACGSSLPSTLAITIIPPPILTVTSSASTICLGGSSTLSVSGSSTYTWQPGNLIGSTIVVSPLSNTTYTVTGTSSIGCVSVDTITITVNPLPLVTANATAAILCAGNSVTLTGGGASTYTWNNNVIDAISFVPTATSTYIVTGTDANGCINTATTTVTINPLPTVTATSSSASVCTGGSVTLTGGGASTYTWDNNVIDAVSFIPTTTTTYMVTGTDANGCVNIASTTVTVNALPIVTLGPDLVQCDGIIIFNAGNIGSTYLWNNASTSQTISVSNSGTYSVLVTDVNGCTNSDTVMATIYPLPVVALGADIIQCGGTIILNAGNPGSTYLWSNTNTSQTISVSNSGTYSVLVTDVNGCTNSDTMMAIFNAPPIVSLGPNIIQCGGNAILDAGNIGSTYLWNNASTTQTITVSTSGTFIVVVTDVNGCVGSDTVAVTINGPPTITASASSVVVCVDDATVSLTGTPTGGVWSGPGVTGSSLSPTAAGVGLQTAIYSYTDANGCEGIASVNVQVNACVGLVENILANGVSVYPNPNSGTFIVSVNVNVDELTLEMLDLQGRVVFYSMGNNIQSGFTKQINMENVANGVYMLRVTTSKEQVSLKVAVQK